MIISPSRYRYQFNPGYYNAAVTIQILLKALTNLPHSDFNLCKSLLEQVHVSVTAGLTGGKLRL